MLKIGLDTESLHLWFQNKRMDIFGFIHTAHDLGLDGVMINLIADYQLDPEWGTLESNDPTHLSKIRALLKQYDMYAEFATKGLDYAHMQRVLEAAELVGADIVRTYIPITLNQPLERKTGGEGRYDLGKIRLDFDPAVYDQAVDSLYRLIPLLKKHRIKIGLENHEYETSEELVRVVEQVNSPWVGLHFDFGNAMMAWEHPEQAARKMAPYTVTTHFKDHIVIPCEDDAFGHVVCGIPIGEGNIDLRKCLDIILNESAITRLNIEMCYPYCAQFKRSVGTGGIHTLGKGCFRVEPALYAPNVLKPSQYYYPQEISAVLLEELLQKQMDGLRRSCAYTKQLCAQYNLLK